MARRFFAVLGLSLLVIGSTAGCQHGAAATADATIVQIGSTKAPGLFGPPAEFCALHPRLEECLGKPVYFRVQPDGPALAMQLEQGNIAYAILSATEYAAIEDPSKLTLLASGVNALGKTSRKAYVVVKAHSHVKTILDCKGKRFAFGTYGDLLTDVAVQRDLEEAGVPVKNLLTEILPPPVAFDGRLYLKSDVAKTIANDITVNAGVIDEVYYESMPDTGGNLITGPSKDQFKIVGETVAVPEMVVVAGPAAESTLTQKLKDYLLNKVKGDENVCQQLGVKAFAPADKGAYDAARKLPTKRQFP
ncbi:MAG: PhnD/SsuA/transferrin family substrate-binding protein [Phycisphaerae bacterium]|nr:PhnD/SsuA/transferrin family substrate-binding protein [Phycisphaerae bacterium]